MEYSYQLIKMYFNKKADKISFVRWWENVARLYKSFPELRLPLVVSGRIDSAGENATSLDKLLRSVLQYNVQAYILNCVNIHIKDVVKESTKVSCKIRILFASQLIHFLDSER